MGPVSYQLLRHKKHLVVAAGLCIVLFLILDHQDIVVMYEQQTPPPPLQFYDNGPDLCIVVRTFKGHGRGIYSLENLLESLQAEMIADRKSAKILLVNTDPRPFYGLQGIISKSRRPEWCEIVELPPEMKKMPWNKLLSGYDYVGTLLFAFSNTFQQPPFVCRTSRCDWIELFLFDKQKMLLLLLETFHGLGKSFFVKKN